MKYIYFIQSFIPLFIFYYTYLFIYLYTVLCKSLRPVVFSPTKKLLSSLFLSFAVVCQWKYQFTFPNIHFAINCNNAVRFLFAQGV